MAPQTEQEDVFLLGWMSMVHFSVTLMRAGSSSSPLPSTLDAGGEGGGEDERDNKKEGRLLDPKPNCDNQAMSASMFKCLQVSTEIVAQSVGIQVK